MSLITVNMSQVKSMFFDRAKLEKSMDKTELKFLAKAGAFVRRSARSSIRKRKKSSVPGQPPSGHTGQLKKLIFFGLLQNGRRRSMVVGPIMGNSTSETPPASGTIPEAMEHGGDIVLREFQLPNGKWVRDDARHRRSHKGGKGQPQRTRRATIQPRPFMQPALKANQSKFPGLWRGQFKK